MRHGISERLHLLKLRRAMSITQAKEILGLPPLSNPTKLEIEKSYREKARANHPDLGGDLEKLKEVNVARDVLMGRQLPTNEDKGRSTSKMPNNPPEPVHVSFEEAMQAARVPTSGVDWLFATEEKFGGSYNSHRGYVAYGRSPTAHVFVGIEHYLGLGGSAAIKVRLNDFKMYVKTAPINKSLASVGPIAIRDIWKNFGDIKRYNGKVHLLDKDFKQFTDFKRLKLPGYPMPFAQALEQIGEQPSEKKGKVEVILELGLDEKYPGMDYAEHRPILIINGHKYLLNAKSTALVQKKQVYRRMLGDLYIARRQKAVITKMRDRAKWLVVWKQICEEAGEPKEVLDALDVAIAQSQKDAA